MQTASIESVDNIFTATQQRVWLQKSEPSRNVHTPWFEVKEEGNFSWEPLRPDRYTGPDGPGPLPKMIDAARRSRSLADLFLVIVPMTFFVEVAQLTNTYCYEDWVVEKVGKDRDDNRKQHPYFKDVPSYNNGLPTEGRRHRASNVIKNYDITPGFVMAWFAILPFHAIAHCVIFV